MKTNFMSIRYYKCFFIVNMKDKVIAFDLLFFQFYCASSVDYGWNKANYEIMKLWNKANYGWNKANYTLQELLLFITASRRQMSAFYHRWN